jgi:hypothetical protein
MCPVHCSKAIAVQLLSCPACHCLQTGVAVYQVVQQEEEQAASGTHAAVDEPASVTRLVIPDEAISSSMMRCVCSEAPQQAASVDFVW